MINRQQHTIKDTQHAQAKKQHLKIMLSIHTKRIFYLTKHKNSKFGIKDK